MLKRDFARRRKRLMDIINTGGIAILPTAPTHIRNRDVEYPFRADSDFYYLTGFPEPEVGRGTGAGPAAGRVRPVLPRA